MNTSIPDFHDMRPYVLPKNAWYISPYLLLGMLLLAVCIVVALFFFVKNKRKREYKRQDFRLNIIKECGLRKGATDTEIIKAISRICPLDVVEDVEMALGLRTAFKNKNMAANVQSVLLVSVISAVKKGKQSTHSAKI